MLGSVLPLILSGPVKKLLAKGGVVSRWIAFVAVVGLLIIAACSGANPVDVNPESDPTDVGPVLDPNREVLADPDGGKLVLAGGDVELDVPAGAVTQDVVLTADPVEDPPEGQVGALPGTVFDLGPDGFEFEQPVVLSFTYDPAVVTEANPNTREEDLRLFTLVEGVWIPTEDSSVDPVTHTVSGSTTHFSRFGVLTLTQVCPGGSLGPTAFDDVQAAYDASVPGGTIEICDGTHSVEGVVLDAPVTIRPSAGASPVIHTIEALSAFFVNGYEAGTVVFDGLTFDFDTPTGPDTPTRSYPIRASGTYDRLVVHNSIFNIDDVARGSIFTELSSVATAATFVDNVELNGGVFGIAVGDNHTEVTNSTISGVALGVYYFATSSPELPTPPTGRVEGSVFVDCGDRCVRVGGAGDVDVISNTFGQCGVQRCVIVQNGAHAEVRLNTFAAQVLTGDAVLDPDQVVFFSQSATGLIDGNLFLGCGFFDCIWASGTMTISNNTFDHVPGQLEWHSSDIIAGGGAVDVLVENNIINSCGAICYKILDGSTFTIRNETINVPAGHDTGTVLFGGKDDPASPNNVITFEDNTVTGVGEAEAQGLVFTASNATVNRNTFTFSEGVVVGDEATLTGHDNIFELTKTAFRIEGDGHADFRFNDFTGQSMDIGFGGDGTSDLTCNYWGNIAGPQNVDPGTPTSVYTPWAAEAIANMVSVSCDALPPPPPDDPPPDSAATRLPGRLGASAPPIGQTVPFLSLFPDATAPKTPENSR